MKMIGNKRGMLDKIFVSIIVIVLSFFVFFVFFAHTTNYLASEVEDNQCRMVVMSKEYSKVPFVGSYFFEIGKRCKVDDIEIENEENEPNTVLEPMGELMKRCWYRYGEGEADFLSEWDSTGEWCFKCASVTFENEDGEIYEYSDLIEWLKENKFKTKDGEISYYDYLNVVSVDGDEKKFKEEWEMIVQEINENKEAGDSDIVEFLLNIGQDNFEFMNSYKTKDINPSEKQYVVLRFDRVKTDLFEDIVDSIELSAGTVATSKTISATTNPIKTSNKIVQGVKNTRNFDVGKLMDNLKSSKPLKSALKKGLKSPPLVLLTSGFFFAASNINSNYVQYVDIMDQEQYYRICGTERYED